MKYDLFCVTEKRGAGGRWDSGVAEFSQCVFNLDKDGMTFVRALFLLLWEKSGIVSILR